MKFKKTAIKTFIVSASVAALAVGVTAFAAGDMPRKLPILFAPPPSTVLGLSGSQATDWDAARNEIIALREAERSQIRQGVEVLQAMVETGKSTTPPTPPSVDDLNKLNDQFTDNAIKDLQAIHDARQQLINVYGTLTPEQEMEIVQSLVDKLQQAKNMHAAMGVLMQGQH